MPKPVRDRIGVNPGEEVEFRINESGEVVVEKATRVKPAGRSSPWRGFFGPGPSTDEILAATRGEDR